MKLYADDASRGFHLRYSSFFTADRKISNHGGNFYDRVSKLLRYGTIRETCCHCSFVCTQLCFRKSTAIFESWESLLQLFSFLSSLSPSILITCLHFAPHLKHKTTGNLHQPLTIKLMALTHTYSHTGSNDRWIFMKRNELRLRKGKSFWTLRWKCADEVLLVMNRWTSWGCVFESQLKAAGALGRDEKAFKIIAQFMAWVETRGTSRINYKLVGKPVLRKIYFYVIKIELRAN